MNFESPERTEAEMFEEMFKHPEKIMSEEFPGEDIAVVDLDPETKKTETPLLIVPGWAAAAKVFKDNAIGFAERGRRTIAITSPHGIGEGKQEAEGRDDMDLPAAEMRKADAVWEVIKNKFGGGSGEKVDVVTHSEAAIFVTEVARQHPEFFRNIVYYAPAGLIGDDSFWSLAKRLRADLATQWKDRKGDEGRPARIRTAFIEGLKAIAGGPKRSLEEAKAIASAQIQENLRQLHKQGIGIVIVHPAGDKAFPMERMQKMVDGDMVDGFVSVGDPKQTGEISDTHNSWYLSPEKYTKGVDAILDSLEAKKKNKEKT